MTSPRREFRRLRRIEATTPSVQLGTRFSIPSHYASGIEKFDLDCRVGTAQGYNRLSHFATILPPI